MSRKSTQSEPSAAKLVAEESVLAHRSLSAQLERIELALGRDDLQHSAHLLNELIHQIRDHFISEESIALGVGLSSVAGGRLLHDAFVERARYLKARCLDSSAGVGNADFSDVIGQELVLLLSDLVENDLRLERSINKVSKHNLI
ncbi:MAG: hypothetical protein NUV50_12040 [Rhodospirillales bacterium]|nr:hypothetical protein [Rhodospirillales bacterium]